MDGCDEKDRDLATNDIPAQKRVYRKPEVIEFGDVRELTLGAAVGSKPDFSGMRRF